MGIGGGGCMSKAQLVISVEHPIVSSRESLSGLDSPPGHRCIHATQSFPSRVWERSFPAFVCIAVRLSELTVTMSSHPRAAICMCVRSLLPSGLLHAIVTEVPTFDI